MLVHQQQQQCQCSNDLIYDNTTQQNNLTVNRNLNKKKHVNLRCLFFLHKQKKNAILRLLPNNISPLTRVGMFYSK